MLTAIREKFDLLREDEEGLGMLEMILIIAVIVILAIIFRDKLKDILESLLGKAKTKTDDFMDNE
ncbi:Flp1 family type IVb pilin [Paenibacillus pinistramenti]|uniref:Flp1 family type IVb pilin n=1 Tax=Paenibacillus pinistramenti TaxID=1768003 RepID=UPI0011096EF6|nr:Flp1 family type IVb pilin [Paenibacillus pinistramenti]